MPMQPRHIPSLDGIRGVAILLVLAHHLSMSVQTHHGALGALWRLCEYGWIGVTLFFVLSGFLITRILIASRGSEGYFRSFYIRRALRIFPLYYLTLIAGLLLLPALTGAPHPTGTAWYWFYGSNLPTTFPSLRGPSAVAVNFAHFWSLAVEEQFYLVWPTIVMALSMRSLERVTVLAIPIAIASRAILSWATARSPGADFFTLSQVDALGIGAFLAVREARGTLESMRTLVRWAWVTAGVGIVISLSWRSWHGGEQDLLFKRSAFAVAAGAAIHATILSRSWLARAMSAAWLRSFGRYSYAIYVLHFLPGETMRYTGASWVGRFVHPQPLADVVWVFGGVALAYAAGWCSWRVLERHFARLKERLTSASPRPAAAPHVPQVDGSAGTG
jgi:peptidoglycan/LPS O-acetylase OafA/YrhL